MCPNDTDKRMDALISNYRRHLSVYKSLLQQLWLKRQLEPEALQEMQSIAHRLSGSGQAYGFREISGVAKELEQALDAACKLSSKELKVAISGPMSRLLMLLNEYGLEEDSALHDLADSASGGEGFSSEKDVNLLIVDDDEHFAAKLLHTLESYGYRAQIEQDITNLESAVDKHEPLALLVDMDFYGHRFAGANEVSLWRRRDGAPLPVIFISKHDSFDLRLASVRAGGNHFLKKPVDISRLIALLHTELNLAPDEPYRVMVVDDDLDLLNLYVTILGDAGYAVSTAANAQDALNLLDQSQPELILIDVNMPGCNGIELGRIIRQHEEFSAIPILFMSASADTDVQLACARLTSDEFINKPIEPWRLLMMVKSRVVKGRQLRSRNVNIAATDVIIVPDALTALPKLDYLRSAIDSALRQERQSLKALVKMDIRDFHTINNLHGKFFGDEVLQRLAWELGQHIKTGNVLCRENGDEFLILLTSCDSLDALNDYINTLIKVVESTVVFSERLPVDLSVDVGVAIATKGTSTADHLLDQADMALFKAKAAGGPEVLYFDDSLRDEQTYRFNLEQEIKTGLDKGEFVAAYQPIFSINGQTIVGFEALARWQHPERGLLGPGIFIPLMEERGLVSRLTEQMLQHVGHQLCYWQDRHPDVFVSLNLSARDIQKPRFIEQLKSLITQDQLSPDHIVLEITESLLLSDWESASPVLDELRRLGVGLALDDFGTGYSSLSYLHRINADKLKIDRSFIQYWSTTGDSRLLRSMVQLGGIMNMTVIAEGIERPEELEFLRQLGCEQYQGFLSAKPMLPEEIEAGGWLSGQLPE